MIIYRKVEINTIHIGQTRIFFDKNGNDVYGVCFLDNVSLLWKCFDYYGYETTITHTIEEIELPTEEEVYDYFANKELEEQYRGCSDLSDYIDGANYILNKIKNEINTRP